MSGPSVSPENRYRLPNGQVGILCMGPSMDHQIIDGLFAQTIRVRRDLGVDADLRARLEAARKRLPPPEIGKHGQIMEWSEDYDEPEPGHRHISQLFALHPGDRISVRKTPDTRASGARDDRTAAGTRRRAYGLEPCVDHQLLGSPRGRRTRARERRRLAREVDAAEPLGPASAVSDRRQFRRHRRDGGNAACKATPASCTCCPRCRAPGPTDRSRDSARVAASRSISRGGPVRRPPRPCARPTTPRTEFVRRKASAWSASRRGGADLRSTRATGPPHLHFERVRRTN